MQKAHIQILDELLQLSILLSYLIKNLMGKLLLLFEKKKIIVKLKSTIKNILKKEIKDDFSFNRLAQRKFR